MVVGGGVVIVVLASAKVKLYPFLTHGEFN